MIIPCCNIDNSCNVISWLFNTLPQGSTDTFYSQRIIAIGVHLPAFYNLLSGSLPPNLTLSSAGVLSGDILAGAEGTYNFTVQVYDAHRCYGTKTYSLIVNSGYYFWGNSPMVFGSSSLVFGQPWPI